jgi:hypothetical protein
VVCFLGAVAAACARPLLTNRMLPGRRDLNRCFREPFEGEDGEIAREALVYLERARPEAVVDLHNNSGHNPAYAIGARADPAHLALASVFVTRFIHSRLRLGSLMEAFAPELPVVTIECGRAGAPSADALARARLARLVALERLPAAAPPMQIFVEPLRVTLRQGATVTFADMPDPASDLTLHGDVERHNFARLERGAHIGWVARSTPLPLEVRDADGRDLTHALFDARDGTLVATQPLVPVMMTTNPAAAATDCLFYVVREA